MNTKAIIAITILTTFLSGTSAIAGDNDYVNASAELPANEPLVIQHAYFLTTTADAIETEETEETLSSK